MKIKLPSRDLKKHPQRRRSCECERTGAVTVEFAVIAVLLTFLVIGIIEISSAILANESLSNAARSGCRLGSRGNGTNTEVIDDVKTVLSDNNIDGNSATVTIEVNGTVKDVSTAKRYDRIAVTVSVPATQVLWISGSFLPGGFELSETIVMMRQK